MIVFGKVFGWVAGFDKTKYNRGKKSCRREYQKDCYAR